MSIPPLDLSRVSWNEELRQESARSSGETTPLHQEPWPSDELVAKVKSVTDKRLSK